MFLLYASLLSVVKSSKVCLIGKAADVGQAEISRLADHMCNRCCLRGGVTSLIGANSVCSSERTLKIEAD